MVKEPKNTIKNLKFIIENESDSNKENIFGIIIGGIEIKYNEVKEQYTRKIKIIDDTFNFTEKINMFKLKFHKFILISIYSKNKEDLENLYNIGDIIWLKRFYFKLYPSGCYQGNEVEFSNWLIFESQKSTYKPKKLKKLKNEKWNNTKLSDAGTKRVKELREFIKKFFRYHSWLFIDWYGDYNNDYLENLKSKKTPFELINRDILCLVELKKTNSFILKDIYLRSFKIQNNKNFDNLIVGDIVYVKYIDIKFKKNENEIKYTDKTSILTIPNNFYDYLDLKNIKGENIEELKLKNGNLNYILELYPFIKDFNVESSHFINHLKINKRKIEYTLVKKFYEKEKILSFEDILKKLENPKKNNNKIFVFECKIDSLAKGYQNLNHIIKLHCQKCNKIKEFTDSVSKCCYIKMMVSFNILFNISGIKNSKDKTEIYLVSDNNYSYSFDTWRVLPPTNDDIKWNKIKISDLENFKKKLIELVNNKPIVKLAAEIINIKNKGILKIRDTLFLPFN